MATEDQLQEFKEAFEVLNKDEDGNDKGEFIFCANICWLAA